MKKFNVLTINKNERLFKILKSKDIEQIFRLMSTHLEHDSNYLLNCDLEGELERYELLSEYVSSYQVFVYYFETNERYEACLYINEFIKSVVTEFNPKVSVETMIEHSINNYRKNIIIDKL